MTESHAAPLSSERLVEALRQPSAYGESTEGSVRCHETHISWVFLTDAFAYKVKKPIQTDYLDYSTLASREHFCREELRLNRRYAPGLYLDVVPITAEDSGLRVGGAGEPVEFAVKMERFPDDALLSQRIERDGLTTKEIRELAACIAEFHTAAPSAPADSHFGQPDSVLEWARGNFPELFDAAIPGTQKTLKRLKHWTESFCDEHATLFRRRVSNGFIRECHGDLHLANVIRWQDQLMPFDGIEFSRELRWIDVLCDAAFMAMDLAARGHQDLAHAFVSDYLEHTGDYASLPVLRFYLVYRALVRAKVAATRAGQPRVPDQEREALTKDCCDHLELAYQYTEPPEPELWIAHGLSGSGKSTGCQSVVERRGAIRLRSDVERKRFYGIRAEHHPSGHEADKLYSQAANEATYGRLRQLARHILRAGYPVVVDATFLKAEQRRAFAEFAAAEQVPFRILDFPCDENTLRQRVADRVAGGHDVSDAGIEVLEQQLRSAEPLEEDERPYVVTMPDATSALEEL